MTEILREIRSRLLEWFERSARDLPWRTTTDPYRIWLSEIMLQQTRVDQAESYYRRFTERYPTVGDLAEADLDRVLRDWEGLGYYARARNMHRAARMIVSEMKGQFPSRHEDVISLPGVGTYTAAAVMSIAFNEPYAVVDGNVARVVSRLFEIGADPRTAAGRREFQQRADELLDVERPGSFNEAMMELGATVCLPRSPQCEDCPLSGYCAAFLNGSTARYPAKKSKGPVPHNSIAVAVIMDRDGRVFIQRREEDGLLGGLWEFPGGKIEADESPLDACHREVREETGARVRILRELPAVEHAYSHFSVTLYPLVCRLVEGEPRTKLQSMWVEVEALRHYAFPRANRKIIDHLTSEWLNDAGRSGDDGVPSS